MEQQIIVYTNPWEKQQQITGLLQTTNSKNCRIVQYSAGRIQAFAKGPSPSLPLPFTYPFSVHNFPSPLDVGPFKLAMVSPSYSSL